MPWSSSEDLTEERMESLESVTHSKGGNKEELKKYTWDEVHHHRSADDCWMVIKGKVYDVSSWVPKHPGGSLIMNGAGRDATPLFISYHPSNVKSMLPKYCIGEITDYSPYYIWESSFYTTLKSRVEECQKKHNLNRTSIEILFKSIFLLACWFMSYYVTLTTGSFIAIIFWGIFHGSIGIQIAHDGNHGSYSKNSFLTRLAANSMDLMGASSLTWEMQHNVGHHPNSNRKGDYYSEDYDPDSKAGYPYCRISPNQEWKPFHRYQHLFIWVLFLGVGLKWLYGDFRALYYRKYQTFEFWNIDKSLVMWSLTTKAFFFYYALYLPCQYLGVSYGIFAFLSFLAAQSYVFILMFGVNHLTEETIFPNENSKERDWAKLQILTSCNYSINSKFWHLASGGLNFQIEHHLFPGICHSYLPLIAPIVQETCKEFGIPYHCFPSYSVALGSYYNHLKILGNPNSKKEH